MLHIVCQMPCYKIHLATHMDRDVPLYQSLTLFNRGREGGAGEEAQKHVPKQNTDFVKAF